MDKMKFNYQVVYNVNTVNRIIFAGVTTLSPAEVLQKSEKDISNALFKNYFIESFVYQPTNSDENGTQESTR